MLHIIPMPNKVKFIKSKNYIMPEKATYSSDFSGVWLHEFILFAAEIGCILTRVSVAADIQFNKGDLSGEEYSLQVGETSIIVTGGESVAMQHASITLRQILLQHSKRIPCVNILDKPSQSFRGFMLDVGRFFYTVEEVKKFIDIMCMHKLNVFHFHLTEDQGWRVEIKRYPNLTIKGQKRTATNFIPKKEEGFYSQEDIKEIVKYCHDRNITVMPEIDMPGHMQAAIACYSELSCFNRSLKVATHFGVKHDILCAGKDSTYEFIFNIIDELCEIFPDKYIHLGGDEVVKVRWKNCPHCNEKLKQLNLKNYEELQAHFMNVVNDYVVGKGRKCMMWNEGSITGKISKDIIWQAYQCEKELMGAVIADTLKSGRSLLNCHSGQNYLDLTYKMIPLKTTYCNQVLLPNQMGLEAALWTEYVPNMKKAYFQTFPRLGAMAENAWTDPDNLNYENFIARLESYYKMLKLMGIYNMAEAKDYEPSAVRAFLKQKWFNRRVFHWHSVHNIIDDHIYAAIDRKNHIKKLAKKEKTEASEKSSVEKK